MTISVIMPCYNAEKYLAACLDSLLDQTMRDFEAILIDDGSSDGTADVAAAYAARDTRLRLIRQENAGVSAARNAGLALAQGDWVFFLDADDLLTPDALDALLACAAEGTDMVVGLHETFGEGQETKVEHPETLWMNKTGAARRHAAALRLIEGDAVLNVMCNKLHRRAFLVREGIALNAGVRIAEDALFNLEAVLCAQDIAFCGRVTYRYRMHAASATQMRSKSEFDTHLPWLRAMAQMLKRRGLLERYYPAYVSSVALRLYKDGGVGGVVRGFEEKAGPLLPAKMDERRLTLWGRVLSRLCARGLYARVYPTIYPFEVLARKVREAKFAWRVRRLRRG